MVTQISCFPGHLVGDVRSLKILHPLLSSQWEVRKQNVGVFFSKENPKGKNLGGYRMNSLLGGLTAVSSWIFTNEEKVLVQWGRECPCSGSVRKSEGGAPNKINST